MNRINNLFSTKQKRYFIHLFFVPAILLARTCKRINTLASKGIDMIEIGIPFSDPMADGPVIQHAATQALKNGMTLQLLFTQLKDIRHKVQIPLILMGYLNPTHAIRLSKTSAVTCKEVGIDELSFPTFLSKIT